MGTDIWERVRCFIQDSYSKKFKFSFPGCIMGFIGAKSLLFAGLPAEMVTIGAYVIKYMGTIIMAFSSGLATSYAAYLIEKFKNKDNVKQPQKRRKKGSDGAA
jgi:hypothetical protein